MASRSKVRKTKSASPDPKNNDQLDKTTSSRVAFISSRELRNQTKCSRSIDAIISPRQNLTASTSSVPLQFDSTVADGNQNQSHLEENHNTDFSSPPECGLNHLNRSHSKILKETHTPSPEKRSVETDCASTSTKKMKRTPESGLVKSDTIDESGKSKCTADAQTLHKSPTNIQAHEIETSDKKNEESEIVITPIVSRRVNRKIKKRSSGETVKNSSKSNFQDSSSVATFIHRSATNVQLQESKVRERNVGEPESASEEKTLSSSGDQSTDLHLVENYSNSDSLCVNESFLNLPTNEEESTTHSNKSQDSSSTNQDFELEKQKEVHSTSVVSSEGMLSNLLSREPLTLLHPMTVEDESLIGTNKDSVERKEGLLVSDVLLEVWRPYLPEIQTETASLSSIDKTSRLTLRLPSNTQNPSVEDGTAGRNIGENESADEGNTMLSSDSLPSGLLSAKDAQSASEGSDVCTLPGMLSNEPSTPMPSETITNAYLLIPNKESEETKESKSIPNVLIETLQPQSPETQPETRLLPLTDVMPNSNLLPPSKPQNSTSEEDEPNIKSKKAQDLPSFSSKKTHSVSNELYSPIETQSLKYSQSKRLTLNTCFRATPSNIFDSGIETERQEYSQSCPKILNSHTLSSCHSPRPNNSSIINIPRRILTFESSDDNPIDGNRSVFSTHSSSSNKESRQYSNNSSTSRSQRGLRRSVSDETLTSTNLLHTHEQSSQSNSLTKSESRKKTSTNFRKIKNDFNRAICIVRPQFRRIQPTVAANTTQNTTEILVQSGQSNEFVMGPIENMLSYELLTLRNNPGVQILRNRADEASTWRNQTEVRRSVINLPYIIYDDESSSSGHQNTITDNNPPYIDVYEGEASTSSHQPPITDSNRQLIHTYVPEASTSRYQPASTDSNPPYIDVYEGQVSTSSHQPAITDDNRRLIRISTPDVLTSRHPPLLVERSFSGLVPFDSSISRNRPMHEVNPLDINVLVEESTRSENQALTSDDSSDYSSSDDSEYVEDRVAIAGCSTYCADWLPPDVAEAHLLLQSVLREMVLFNGDLEDWRDMAFWFRRLSQSSSDRARRRLKLDTYSYWGKVMLRRRNRDFITQSMPIDLFFESTFETLILTVATTLDSTFQVHSDGKLYDLIDRYERFRREYDRYWSFWENHNVENLRNEALRLQVKSWKKITNRVMLLTMTAFRLLLMYIGENMGTGEIIRIFFEEKLAHEDKIYLRQ